MNPFGFLLGSRATRPANPLFDLVHASRSRKEDADKRLRYYADGQAAETLKLIARHWSDPSEFQIFSLNIVKKVTNKRAALYRLAPRRTFTGWDQAAGEALYRAINANGLLKRASRLTKLLKTTALQVGFDVARKVPTLSVVTPNILDVVYSDPQYPTDYVVTHNAGSKPTDVSYSHWTATTFQRFDYKGKPLPVPGNPDGLNPYGVLPFVPLFEQLPDDAFFLPGGNDLIEAQEALNVGVCNLWRSIRLQSFGQPWATGVAAGEAIDVGPNRAITLPENGKFGFASPNAPIGDILAALTFLMREVAATNDLSADIFDLDRRSESGAAKEIGQVDLYEARSDDLALWLGYEARLFDVLRAVVNTHLPGSIPESAAVHVDFADMDSGLLDEGTRLTNASKKLEMGVISPVDILMSESREAFPTRELAMAELLRRKDEAAQIVTME
jgi:hypothetical protein